MVLEQLTAATWPKSVLTADLSVYTTTFRRLFDPSAFRLENFWWHVWGSHTLRNLSGPALAKLFEEFSEGPTFVPLPSPVNRYMRSKVSHLDGIGGI